MIDCAYYVLPTLLLLSISFTAIYHYLRQAEKNCFERTKFRENPTPIRFPRYSSLKSTFFPTSRAYVRYVIFAALWCAETNSHNRSYVEREVSILRRYIVLFRHVQDLKDLGRKYGKTKEEQTNTSLGWNASFPLLLSDTTSPKRKQNHHHHHRLSTVRKEKVIFGLEPGHGLLPTWCQYSTLAAAKISPWLYPEFRQNVSAEGLSNNVLNQTYTRCLSLTSVCWANWLSALSFRNIRVSFSAEGKAFSIRANVVMCMRRRKGTASVIVVFTSWTCYLQQQQISDMYFASLN